MKTRKRYYSNEFKAEAVRLSNQRDNIKELAEELGISVERIYKWRSVNGSNGSLKTRSINSPEVVIILLLGWFSLKMIRKS